MNEIQQIANYRLISIIMQSVIPNIKNDDVKQLVLKDCHLILDF